MVLGGGTFTSQNKVLPGSYINFVSAARASSSLSDRGVAAIAIELDWGQEGKVFTVNNEEFQRYSQFIFGYEYTHEKLIGIRELFLNAKTLHLYRLGKGVKAANNYATAMHGGIRGNDLKIVIAKNADNPSDFDVSTLLDNKRVDTQTVSVATKLIDNDFVQFKKDATLAVSAGVPLTGGTNASSITGEDHQTFLDKIEPFNFHTLGCTSITEAVKSLYIAFTKRLRDEVGAKFQTVLYKANSVDYEGIISVENKVTDAETNEASLIYWTTGAAAGCPVNKSNTNKKYDGEFTVDVDYKQLQLQDALKAGKFIFHRVGDEVRVLEDINTFVSFTSEKNDDFKYNQTIRVLDQIANDIAVLFNGRYLGKIQNNPSGRISFWNDIVKHHQELEQIQAIEDFKPDDVVVEQGDSKKSVLVSDTVTVTNAMGQLYMTVSVK
ncbi:phage tail sheath family protein [Peribacillus loiseleuriae]|uniref:Phage tail sheath protein n=1 Tax=Peribacillus loiseleuriae TaxID=1679170 RepID=A0A0K9GRH4_9BACI|nr:phage tail sheath family protein [Peribacillus loiseleuriae]KMY49233.1 phage tail sheath protein [Peribacillus loiseleuriae]